MAGRWRSAAAVSALACALTLAGPGAGATVDTGTRTLSAGDLSITWDQNNPDEVTGITWNPAGGGSHSDYVASGGSACDGDVKEGFGGSYNAGDGGSILADVAGFRGSWTGLDDNTVATSGHEDSGCGYHGTPDVSTEYFVPPGSPDELEVTRTFDFGTSFPSNADLRPYVPRVPAATFGTVLYPTTDHTLASVSPGNNQTVGNWAGGWYADDTGSGRGLLVVRDPGNELTADLQLDTDTTSASNDTSVIVHSPDSPDWTGVHSETDYLCFYDSTTWSASDRDALRLPAGCGPTATRAATGPILFDRPAGSHSQLFSVKPDGSGLTQLTHDAGQLSGADNTDPVWSPDGTRIAFLSGNQIFVMNADGTGATDLTPNQPADITDGELSWAPDGGSLVFSRVNYAVTDPQFDIYRISIAGTDLTDLTNTSGVDERTPAVNPADGSIAYQRDGSAIWTMAADGSNPAAVSALTSLSPSNPAWSPDGKTIGVVSSNCCLYTYQPGGASQPAQLSDGSDVDASSLAWSPDATQLAVAGLPTDGTAGRLYTYPVAGGSPTAIPNTQNAENPSWQPSTKVHCDDTYTGSDGGDWYDGGNWSTGSVPGTTDVACLAGHSVTVDREGGDPDVTVEAVENGSLDVINGTMTVTGASHPSNLQGGHLHIGAAQHSPTFAFDGTGIHRMTVGDYTQLTGNNDGTGEIDVTGNFDWESGLYAGSQITPCQNECGALIDQTASDKTFTIRGTGQQLLYGVTLETDSPATISSSDPSNGGQAGFAMALHAHLITNAGLTLDHTVIPADGSGTDTTITDNGTLTTVGTSGWQGGEFDMFGPSTDLGGDCSFNHAQLSSATTVNVPSGDTFTIGAGTVAGTITGNGAASLGNVAVTGTGHLTVHDFTSTYAVTVAGGAQYAVSGTTTMAGDLMLDPSTASTGALTIAAQGVQLYGHGQLQVNGDVDWQAGQIGGGSNQPFLLRQDGGHSFTIEGGAQHYLYDGQVTTASPVTMNAPIVPAYGSTLSTSATMTVADGVDLQQNGTPDATFSAAGLSLPAAATDSYGFGPYNLALTGGTTAVRSGTLTAGTIAVAPGAALIDDATVDGNVGTSGTGTVSGTGTISGNLANGGVVEPGDPTGTLTVTGAYAQSGQGSLRLRATTSTAHGALSVGSSAGVSGGDIQVLASYSVSTGDHFTGLTATDTLVVQASVSTPGWTGAVGADQHSYVLTATQAAQAGPDVATTVAATNPETGQPVTSVGVGGAVKVTATVADHGTAAAHKVAVSLSIDPSEWQPVSPPTVAGGSCQLGSSGYACVIPTIAAGGSIPVTAQFQLADPGTAKLAVTSRTADDTNPANDTAALSLTVNPAPSAALTVTAATSASRVQAGQPETITATVTNVGGQDAVAPVNLSLTVPHGQPAGQVVAVTSVSGAGWTCRTVSLPTDSVVSCSSPATLPAGQKSTPVTLALGTATVQANSLVVVPALARAANVASPGAARAAFTVTAAGHGAISLQVQAPHELAVGDTGQLTVDLTDSGNAPLLAGATVKLPSVAGLTLAPDTSGTDWTCRRSSTGTTLSLVGASLVSAPQTCTTTDQILAGNTAAPLTVTLSAPAVPSRLAGLVRLPSGVIPPGGDTTGNDGPRTLVISATGADYNGPLVATTTATIARATTGLPTFQTNAHAVDGYTPPPGTAGAQFNVSIANIGSADAIGPLTFTEAIPDGFTASVAASPQAAAHQGAKGATSLSALGFSCDASSQTLTCDYSPNDTQQATLSRGATTPTLTITLTSTTKQTSGDASQLLNASGKLALQSSVEGGGITSFSSAANVNIAQIKADQQQVAGIAMTLAPSSNPLSRGQQADIVLTLKNNSATPFYDDPIVVAVSLPPGVTPGDLPYDDQPLPANPRGPPWSCLSLPDTDAPGATPMVVCQHRYESSDEMGGAGHASDLATGQLQIPVTVAQNAGDLLTFSAGLASQTVVTTSPKAGSTPYFHGTDDPLYDAARAFVNGGVTGPTVLTAQAEVDVTGWQADAGKPQTVQGKTLAPTRQTPSNAAPTPPAAVPTTVHLDASATTGSGSPQTFAWRQLSGPAVTWGPAAPGVAPGGSLPAFPKVHLCLHGSCGLFPYNFDGTANPDAYGAKPSFTVPQSHTQQRLSFRVYVTDGTVVHTADTTVTVQPAPDTPPVINQVAVQTAAGNARPVSYTPGTAIAAGTKVILTAGATDADGDPLTYTWSAPTGVPLTQSGNQATLTWPSGTPRMPITVGVFDGQQDQSHHPISTHSAVTLGVPQSAMQLSLQPSSSTVQPGGQVTVVPTVTGGDAGPTTYSYSVTPATATLGTPAANGAVTVTAPRSAAVGATITVTGQAVRPGQSSAQVPVSLTVVADPLGVTVGPLPTATFGGSPIQFTPTVTGTGAALTACLVVSPTDCESAASGLGAVSVSQGKVSFTPPASGSVAQVTVRLQVADGTGATKTLDVPIPLLSAGITQASCDPSSPVGQAIAAVKARVPTTITIGSFTFSLPVPNVSGDCTAGAGGTPQVSFHNAAATIGPVQFTGLTGTLTEDQFTLNAGTVTVPSAWRIGSAQIGANNGPPLTVALSGPHAPSASGSVTFQGVPLLTDSPSATTTLSFGLSGGSDLTIDGHGALLGGTLDVSIDYPGGGQPWTIAATATGLKPFGGSSTLSATGTGTVDPNSGTFSTALSLTQPLSVAGGAATINSGELDISNAGLVAKNIQAQVNAGGSKLVSLTLGGSLDVDTGDWSLTTTAASGGGPDLPGGLHTSTFAGSIADTGGKVVFDLKGSVAGTLTAGPFSTSGALTAELTNNSGCDSNAGGTWLEATGSGTATIAGSTTPQIDADLCFDPASQAYTLTSRTGGNGWQPFRGLTVDQLALDLSGTGLNFPDFKLSARITAEGVTGTADIQSVTSNGTTNYLFDVGADLSGLHIPGLSSGYLAYWTGPETTLTLPDVGFGPVSNVDLKNGFSVAFHVGVSSMLPSSVINAVQADLKSPRLLTGDVNFVGNFDGTGLTVTGQLDLRGAGIRIIDKPDTRLQLTTAFLQFSTAGTFSIGATACLDQRETATGDSRQTQLVAASQACTATDANGLKLTAEVTVDLVHTSVAASLTAQNWHNAFGISGLTLGTITAQLGFDGNAPSLGFGVTVTQLPTKWCNGLGVVNCDTPREEPIQLVVNISETQPILDFELGTPNGQSVIQPLKPLLGASHADDVEIDDAALIIAPKGGVVGPYHYDPGTFALRFDSTILNTAVDVDANLTLPSGGNTTGWGLSALVHVGAFNVGALAVHDTTFDLEVQPAKREFGVLACGGVSLGATTVQARFELTAVHVPSAFATECADAVPGSSNDVQSGSGLFHLQFDANVAGLTLVPGVATLNSLHVYIDSNLGSFTVPSATFGITGDMTLFSTQVQVGGSVTIGPLGITGISAFVDAPHPVDVGPISIGAASDAPDPTAGPKISVSADLLQAQFHVHLDGSVAMLGGRLDVQADVGTDEIRASGSAGFSPSSNATLAQFSLGFGIFYGSDSQLQADGATYSTLNATDTGLVSHQAHSGDVAAWGYGSLCLAVASNGSGGSGCAQDDPAKSATLIAGSLAIAKTGPTAFEAGFGANFDAFGGGVSIHISGNICTSNDASCPISGVNALGPVIFQFTGTGQIRIGSFAMVNASLTVNSNPLISVQADFDLGNGILQGTINGDIGKNSSGGIAYTISASINANLSSLGLDLQGGTYLEVTDEDPATNYAPTFEGNVNAKAYVLTFSGSWVISTNNVSINIASSVSLNPVPAWISVTARYNNGDLSGTFDFSVGPFYFGATADVSSGHALISADPGFSVLDGAFSADLSVSVDIGFGVGNRTYYYPYGETVTLPPWLGFSSSLTLNASLLGIGINSAFSVSTNPFEVCGDVVFKNFIHDVDFGTVCLPRDLDL